MPHKKHHASSLLLSHTHPGEQHILEGWMVASGIALGFYAAFQLPRSPGLVVALVLGITAAFTMLMSLRYLGTRQMQEEGTRFLGRYAMYVLIGVLVFFALAMLFGPYVTGSDYPIRFY